MRWYPKSNAHLVGRVISQLDPEIQALPTWHNGHKTKRGWERCPVCDGYKRVNDATTDLLRNCRACKGNGKVLKK